MVPPSLSAVDRAWIELTIITRRVRAADAVVPQRSQLAADDLRDLHPQRSSIGCLAVSLACSWAYEMVSQERREGAEQHDSQGHRHHSHHPTGVRHRVAVAEADRGDGDV